MVNAGKTGSHMTGKVFKESFKRIKNFNSKILIISGGEPTEHPQFEEYMDFVLANSDFKYVIVTSNGMFLEDPKRRDNYLSKYQFQITNDSRYYPIKIKEVKHKNILSWDIVRNGIEICSRVIKNKIPVEFNKPKCFNIRSFAKKYGNMWHLIMSIEYVLGKFCVPGIRPNGDIVLGECDLCKPVGTIYDLDENLLDNIRKFKCNNCGCFDNLDKLHREYLGE
jgi:hypothetical protein